MSVYTKSNKKSWAEKGKVKLLPHARRDWPWYISVVIKATFHVSVAFPIIFTLLLLQFKRIPPCTWYSREENSNKHPLRGNRFKMSQSDSHPSCGWSVCHLHCKWTGEHCVLAWVCVCAAAGVCTHSFLACVTACKHQEKWLPPTSLKRSNMEIIKPTVNKVEMKQ